VILAAKAGLGGGKGRAPIVSIQVSIVAGFADESASITAFKDFASFTRSPLNTLTRTVLAAPAIAQITLVISKDIRSTSDIAGSAVGAIGKQVSTCIITRT